MFVCVGAGGSSSNEATLASPWVRGQEGDMGGRVLTGTGRTKRGCNKIPSASCLPLSPLCPASGVQAVIGGHAGSP